MFSFSDIWSFTEIRLIPRCLCSKSSLEKSPSQQQETATWLAHSSAAGWGREKAQEPSMTLYLTVGSPWALTLCSSWLMVAFQAPWLTCDPSASNLPVREHTPEILGGVGLQGAVRLADGRKSLRYSRSLAGHMAPFSQPGFVGDYLSSVSIIFKRQNLTYLWTLALKFASDKSDKWKVQV